jgi:hypothetical protein
LRKLLLTLPAACLDGSSIPLSEISGERVIAPRDATLPLSA